MGANPRAFVVVVDPYSSGVIYAPALRRSGFSPVAVLSFPGPSPDFTTTFCPADFDLELSADQGTTRVAERLAALRPTAVVPGTESGVLLADELAAVLTPGLANLPELSYARRHKGAMAAAVQASGVPVARTLCASQADEVEQWIVDQGLAGIDLVVKPAMAAGTEGVSLARGGRGWRSAFERLLGQLNAMGVVNNDIVVQERLIGTEFAVDTFSFDGVHTVTDICRYGKRATESSFAVYDHVEFLDYHGERHGEMINYVTRMLDALGIRFGPVHSEVMLTSDGIRLIEANARLAGGGMAQAASLATGETAVDRLVRFLCGARDIRPDFTLQRTVMTVLFVAPRAGTVSNVEGYERIRTLQTCRHLRIKVANGDVVPETSDLMSTMRLGWAVLADRNTERVHADYRRARAMADGVRFV